MSLSNRSAPNPIVKIGTDFARNDNSSSPIGARRLSAPSDSTTNPDNGTASNSCRACSMPSPKCVAFAENVRSAALSMRCAPAENLKRRTMNLARSDLRIALVRAARKACSTQSLRGFPSRSATRMLRESSIQHADVIALRHRRPESRKHGTEQARRQQHEHGDAHAAKNPSIAPRALPADAGVAQHGRNADRDRDEQHDHHRNGCAKGETTLRELRRPVFEQELKNSVEPVGHCD